MPKAIVIHQHGGPEVLKLEDVPVQDPKPGELLIQHTAIGVNFIDTYQRSGAYPLTLPAIPGMEACGVIEAVGEGIEGFKVGDRVAYCTAPGGAYSQYRTIDQSYVVAVPDDISNEVAAAMLAKGMTAHFLLRRTFFVRPNFVILVHAAAGGMGQILCQWARHLGAYVIGTVSSHEKALIAEANGCNAVINYTTEDFVARVKEITSGAGVQAVYDAVGKDTFVKSLECLCTLGIMISYGQASGPVPPFDVGLLAKNSLFLTRPSLFHYKKDRMELVLTAGEVFDFLRRGIITPSIKHRYPLAKAAEAHKDLEARRTTGSCILTL